MALQASVALRDALNDTFESTIGTAAVVEIRTGAQPATCATASSGTLLASMTLASDWMNASSSGVKTKLGTWSDASANATGTAAHFRLFSSGATCHFQGTVTVTGGGGDLTLDSVSITAAQVVTITAFTLTGFGA